MSNLTDKLSTLERKEIEPIRSGNSRVYLLFPLIIAVFLAIFAWNNRHLLQSAVDLNVASAIAVKSAPGSHQLPENSVVFQAAGWIEADPYATEITPFISGIIDKVNVIDGQVVKKGEVLAVINNEELSIEADTLKNRLDQQKVLVKIAKAARDKVKAQIAQLNKRVDTLKAATAKAKNLFDAYQTNSKTLSRLKVDQAELAYKKDLSAQKAAKNESVELSQELKLKEEQIKLASVQLKGAELKLKRLLLDLSRCVIKSPVEGVVMDITTAPGKSEGPGRALMKVFNPNALQVRVDVLFADAPAMRLNQNTQIKLDALPDRKLKGIVTSIVGQADLQRNTIQAKVKILDPVPLLRPEMLARVQFLSTPTDQELETDTSEKSVVTLVPASALINKSGSQAKVWVVSRSSNTTQSREVRLGVPRENNWIEVDGVNPGEWVVENPPSELENGRKVKVKSH